MMRTSSTPVMKSCAAAATRIFMPLVGMFLRHGIPYKTVAEWLRWCYVKVAMEDFKIPKRKQTKSRVAVLTGLTRVDVDRLLNRKPPAETDTIEQYQRAAKVLTGWARDERYHNGDGTALDLPFDGATPSFTQLVDHFSGGAPPRAILDELIRVKAVRRTKSRTIRLVTPQYVPLTGKDSLQQLDILGHATGGLVTAVAHNTAPECDETWLQGLAANHRIPASRLEEVSRHIKAMGRELLFEIDDYLYNQALDESETADEPLSEAGFGVYFFRNNDPHGGGEAIR